MYIEGYDRLDKIDREQVASFICGLLTREKYTSKLDLVSEGYGKLDKTDRENVSAFIDELLTGKECKEKYAVEGNLIYLGGKQGWNK